jgi:protein-S-isoprenylcysteine O-methyltransferase Ste14
MTAVRARRSFLRNLLQGMANLAVLVVVLFVSAGRPNLPFFWVYVGVNLALMVGLAVGVDPELMEERWHPAAERRQLAPLLVVRVPLYVGHLAIAGLDVGRFHWSRVSPLAQITALVLFAASWALVDWAMIANRFFSSVVRIQMERGHHVVTTGPYRYVRHPGYAGGVAGFALKPVVLGSWWALVPLVPILVYVFWRTAVEDRFLRKELSGYAVYAERVRYRLIPGMW